MGLNKVLDFLEKGPIIKMKDYEYFITPLELEIRPDLIRDITTEIIKIADLDVDNIVTVEAKGICISTALSIATGIPTIVVRKRKYGIDGEIELIQKTGYSTSSLFLNQIYGCERVIIIDDLISSGGTLISLINTLKNIGSDIKDIVVVFDKIHLGGSKLIKRKTGFTIKSLINVKIHNGKICAKINRHS
jgi:adenine phosphoribosyltransferase